MTPLESMIQRVGFDTTHAASLMMIARILHVEDHDDASQAVFEIACAFVAEKKLNSDAVIVTAEMLMGAAAAVTYSSNDAAAELFGRLMKGEG